MPAMKFKPKHSHEAMVMRYDYGSVGDKKRCREQCVYSKLWIAAK